MGNIISWSAPEEPPTVVLVPPLIDSRERGRSRFAKSSYDRAFGQQQIRILFNDFLPNDTRGTLRFSPPEDPRISVVAKLRTPQTLAPSPSKKAKPSTSNVWQKGEPEGKMTLRYQPDPDVPWTFCDIKARAGPQGSLATVRGCYFNPSANAAIFGILPLAADPNADGAVTASNLRLGVRYTAPSFSSGAIFNPVKGILHQAWAVARAEGLVFGVQTEPHIEIESSLFTRIAPGVWSNASAACSEALSWGCAYQPVGQSAYGKGIFTAAVELRRRRELVVSFLHHMATQRNVVNPLEKSDVVGITNYLDLAFQMVTDLSSSSSTNDTHGKESGGTAGSGPSMRLAAAWQANKNVQVKARLGLDGIAAGVVVKSWWHPAFTLGMCISKPSTGNMSSPMKLGITATLESWRALRYERSAEGQKLSGARVTQRHVASEEDIAYHEGEGLLVPLSEVDNPEVLGQKVPTGGDYM